MRVTDCNCLECRTDCYVCDRIYPYNQGDCTKNFTHWANSEYKEHKVFTPQERAVLRALDNIEWVARDIDGKVWGYSHKPYMIGGYWHNTGDASVDLSGATSCKFEAIKSTDTKPTMRAEILGGSEE